MKTGNPTIEELIRQKREAARLRKLNAQFKGRIRVVDSKGREPKGFRFDSAKKK